MIQGGGDLKGGGDLLPGLGGLRVREGESKIGDDGAIPGGMFITAALLSSHNLNPWDVSHPLFSPLSVMR